MSAVSAFVMHPAVRDRLHEQGWDDARIADGIDQALGELRHRTWSAPDGRPTDHLSHCTAERCRRCDAIMYGYLRRAREHGALADGWFS